MRKRIGRAVALYRWALVVEPRNADLHAKLAPLLAEAGEEFDAWLSFRAHAQAELRDGKIDEALAVYREAAHHLPRDYRVWECMARLQRKRRRDSEAVEVLLEGARKLKKHWMRAEAVYLLRRAREVAPWHSTAVLELARLLAANHQREEARLLLDGLAGRCRGRDLRRVRGVEMRVSPGLGSFWRWIRSVADGDTAAAARPRNWSLLRSRSARP